MRWFHGPAKNVLAPTQGVVDELHSHGITNAITWCRGVDLEQFHPNHKAVYDLPRPIFLYAGRIAIEKNIEAFLNADLPGTKVMVGDGPAKNALEKKYPAVHWAGYRFGPDLAAHYADADVFVFPSRTDTFGIVMLEANACGVPVAAFPVTGPIDVVKNGLTGFLIDDLAVAANKCLELKSEDCIAHAKANSWNRCAKILADALAIIQ
jgi:glycosyltransferase involved in cell wall biosynthesis